MSASKARSIVDGLSLSIAAAPAVYSVLRVGSLAIAPELDPTAMLWTERSATLDRLSLTLYATALTSSATFAIARKFADKMDVMLVGVSALSACALALQAVLVP
jgi:hypothetical protein